MSDAQLQELVEQVSLKYFGKAFHHQAYLNGRLRTTGGRYHLKTHNIDINKEMANTLPTDQLIGIIKHELVHYHLHLAGYSGSHRSPEFKRMLKAVGGSRYAPKVVSKETHYVYQCVRCGKEYRRVRRMNVRRYVCSECHGRLKLQKTM